MAISEEQAVAKAKEVADREGWSWPPGEVRVSREINRTTTRERRRYDLIVQVSERGCVDCEALSVAIDQETGEVIWGSYCRGGRNLPVELKLDHRPVGF